MEYSVEFSGLKKIATPEYGVAIIKLSSLRLIRVLQY